MKIESLHCSSLAIPFHTAFKHASAERASTQTFWVEVKTKDGTTGYGEGCPREYVTNESLTSAQQFLVDYRLDLIDKISDVQALVEWTYRHQDIIDHHPSAWAAIEMALLDLLGKVGAQSVEDLLNLPKLEGQFLYTAVLGDTSSQEFEKQLAHYLHTGFKTFKIKLSSNPSRNMEKIKLLAAAEISPSYVRADANNLWTDADHALRDLAMLNFPFFAVEEPLPTGDYEGMHRIAHDLGTRIILDESFLRSAQISHLREHPDRWIVNLRISKMGGLLRSLDLTRVLRETGLHIILGGHVGETSLLTRAALIVANVAGDILLAQEGAFGTHLLKEDVVKPPLMFGKAGILNIANFDIGRTGFGLNVSQSATQFHQTPIM